MTRPILQVPDQWLSRPCRKVDIESEAKLINEVCDDLWAALRAGHLGLAAPQIGHGVRIVLVRLPHPTFLINPELTPDARVPKELGLERCLSVNAAESMWEVPRWQRVSLTFMPRGGTKPKTRTLIGKQAVLVQHEVDHLFGLTIDRTGVKS